MPNRSPSLLLFVAVAIAVSAAAQDLPWLHAPIELPPMSGEFELLGDFDSDGDPDAISFHSPMQNAIKATYTVWTNDGAGAFTAGAPVTLPGGAGTRVLLADVDGNGHPDLIVSTITSSPLGAGLLLFAGQGNGTFAPYVHLPLPGNVLFLGSGRGNSDAIPDLLVCHGDVTGLPTRWLFGAPGLALTMGPGVTLPAAFDLCVVDGDGDGIDDVALPTDTGAGPEALQFHLTTPSGFQLGPSVQLPPSISHHLIALDHDGDGDRDVLAYFVGTVNTMSFSLATNLGGGNWSVGTQTFQIPGLGGVFVGDWDGDGRDDAVVRSTNSGTVGQESHYGYWFRSTPGGFESAYWLLLGGGTLAYGAGLADLNGDHRLDLLDAKSVYFGDGTFDSPFGTGVTSPLVDWDGDGDQDVLGSGANVAIHDGNGALVTKPFSYPALPPNHVYAGSGLVTDLDGDGRHEVLIGVLELVLFQYVFRGTHLLRETTDQQFAFVGLATAAPGRLDAGVVVDTDGDGDRDIVNRSGLWQNDGTGYFTLLGPITTDYEPIAKGDVDGDGDEDLLATTTGAGTSLAILHRTAPNTFTTSVLFAPIGVTIVPVTPTRFFDVDDDGDLDVVARNRQSNGIWQALVFTNQSGVFTQSVVLPTPGTALVGDIDGDGVTDLAFSDVYRLHVLRRTGPGLTYAPPVTFLTVQSNLLVDFDQDGDLDATGQGLVQNTLHAAHNGYRRQYGQGSPGAGGWRPLLSVRGAIRETLSPSISLRAAVGGAPAFLVLGSGPNDAPSLFLPGVQSYVAPIDLLVGFTAGGALGQPGAGSLDVPVSLPPGLAGSQFYLEFVTLDLSVPFAFTHSNGCELAVGH